jgi:hypothetical protein
LSELDALLGTPGPPTAVVISAIDGTAGIGKTALAVHWAHRVAGQFPDGQLYVNLRGFDPDGPVLTPDKAIRGFLDALQVDPHRVPSTLDAQAALFRSLLTGRRMLIVLDNARDSDQVRHLLPGTRGCLVLVTSRNLLTGLLATHGAHPLTLDLLSDGEARDLLIQRLGAARVTAEPEAVDQLVATCARLPLALAIVAARAQRTGFALAALAAELRDAGHGLDALDTGDPASQVRAVFSWSYTTLSAPAARLFRLLGLHPGPDIDAAAAAGLTARPLPETRRLLTELTRVNLLTEHLPGRYTFHDLLRAYATEQTHAVDTDHQRRAATTRLLDHYLHTSNMAERLLNPTKEAVDLLPAQPGVTPHQLADRQQALDWFTIERPVLLAAVEHAAATGLDTHAWQLPWTMWTFLNRQGHWHDWAAAGRVAVAAAKRVADLPTQARAHRALADAYTPMGRSPTPTPSCGTPWSWPCEPVTGPDRAVSIVDCRCCGTGAATPGGPSTTPGGPSTCTRSPGTSTARRTRSTRSVGTTPYSVITNRLSSPAGRPSSCTRTWATTTARPPPGTASGTHTTFSASTRKPSPATSTH